MKTLEEYKKQSEFKTDGRLSDNQPLKKDQEPNEAETEGGANQRVQKDELSGPAIDLVGQPDGEE